ncbi:MAG: hypothetical protein CFE23_10295 [Flavobacterium sp. BFFFF1]|nr:MAG: hypothetical protein CFE23_10295 [Flavobacterium sp. BFFFF1]
MRDLLPAAKDSLPVAKDLLPVGKDALPVGNAWQKYPVAGIVWGIGEGYIGAVEVGDKRGL